MFFWLYPFTTCTRINIRSIVDFPVDSIWNYALSNHSSLVSFDETICLFFEGGSNLFFKHEHAFKAMKGPIGCNNFVLIEWIIKWALWCTSFTYWMRIIFFMAIFHGILMDKRISPINTLINDEEKIDSQHPKVTLSNYLLNQHILSS